MPRRIGIQDEASVGTAIGEAVSCLESGGTVGFPGSTSYCAAAMLTCGNAVGNLFEDNPGCRLALADSDQAVDIVPDLSVPASRLMRRCWPGPLVVRASPQQALNGLEPGVRKALSASGQVELVVPEEPMLRAVLGRLTAPLIISDDTNTVTNADQLCDRYPNLDVVVEAGPPMYGDRASVIEPTGDGFRLLHAGILSEQAIRVSACRIYVFVCTGNTCRSPLAEGLFRNLLAERLDCAVDDLVDRGFLVQSAGLAAGSASPASFESVELLRRRGIDLSNHASQPVSEQLLNASDHIYTMTRGHQDAILRFRPDLADRVEVLRRDGLDVVDPIGGGMGEYERCEREIEESLRAILADHLPEEG